jgi:hypothetical protein
LVWVGLKEPQAPVLPQVAVQSTPLFEESLETVALIAAVASTAIDDGGAWVMLRLTEEELEQETRHKP